MPVPGDSLTAPGSQKSHLLTGDTAIRCHNAMTVPVTDHQPVAVDTSDRDWHPGWDPLKDRDWQVRKYLGLIKAYWRSMKRAGFISPKMRLRIDDLAFRKWLDEYLPRIMDYDIRSGVLSLTTEAGEFLFVMKKSWWGMRQPYKKGKWSPWLRCRGTNDIAKFTERYERLKSDLEKHSEMEVDIEKLAGSPGDDFRIYLGNHFWGYRWRTRGDPLIEEPPQEILDAEELKFQTNNVEWQLTAAKSLKERFPEKTTAQIVLDEGRRYLDKMFTWVILRVVGRYAEAAKYEKTARDYARRFPELLHYYRSRFPDAFKNFAEERRRNGDK